jgi:hypothetical protein
MVVVGQKFGRNFVRVLELVGAAVFMTENLFPFFGHINKAFFMGIPDLNAYIFERRGGCIGVVREE